MQIDWITVAAQIVNFLALVWILHRLLYRPVTRAMQRRAADIRDRFAEAERREALAVEEADRLRAQQRDVEAARAGVLAEAEAEAAALRARLEEEARAAVAARRAEWEDQLDREQAAFLADLRRGTAAHVARVARRVLDDLAGAALEEAVVDTFIGRLRALEGKPLDELRAEAVAAGGEMAVSSAFDLSDGMRARLCSALDRVHDAPRVGFDRDPALVCGIRLRIRGQTVQWTVDAYLDDLQNEVAAQIDRGARDRAAE
ncbi:hypothetical protein [Rhodovulum marinum]|uniref:ATP synthase subunit b n=1 Tax=Rhodovulum marinum TaxID=320662 RepID=A0A4V2SQG6_9RHOB|nr:hypothetical protein [Rhodovulum marinum]TCP38916.1 ATP synthase F0 subcomplex B subunit [Rhodovulum marinum]